MYRKQIIFSSTLILFLLYTTSKARLQDEKSNEDSRQQKSIHQSMTKYIIKIHIYLVFSTANYRHFSVRRSDF